MAVAAGVLPVGVSWGNHPVVELRAVGAEHVLDHFAELLELLR
jgi:phosphoglycolate phosphatase-like HAD superfamily hydrolase